MTSASLTGRRVVLENLLPAPAGAWQLTNRFAGPITEELLATARHAGLEGLVLKGDGPYRPGLRSKDWVKLKFRHTRLAVIGGRATDSSSLAIGVFHNGQLRYVVQLGMAMPHAQADQLDAFLRRIRQTDSPFADLAEGAAVAFVEPHIVVEVSYLEVTRARDNAPPSLDAVRPDIAAETVVADAELADALSARGGPVKMRANQRL